jgi:hypothetical protein
MTPTCVRCGAPAFAAPRVEATIGETRLAVSKHGEATPICALCMVEGQQVYREWLRAPNQDRQRWALEPLGLEPRGAEPPFKLTEEAMRREKTA